MFARSRPADPRNADQFVCQLERLLKRLGDLHLRISLARLPLGEQGNDTTPIGQAIVDNLQDPGALAGTMPDGSVVAAFLGPRDGAGDDEMAERIRRRFERALRLSGTDGVAGSTNSNSASGKAATSSLARSATANHATAIQ